MFSVAENIVLGNETMANPVFLDLHKSEGRIRQLATQLGFEIDPDAIVGDLSVGIQQRIEILKALYRGARSSSLMSRLPCSRPRRRSRSSRSCAGRRRGTSIVFISHKLYEVLSIADRITVIRRGRVVGQADPKTATEGARRDDGRARSLARGRKGPAHPGDVVLEVEDLTVADDRGTVVVDGASFQVRAGEIFGVAGVAGMARPSSSRRSTASGGAAAAREPGRRRRHEPLVARALGARGGIHPGDRQRYGLVLSYPIEDNLGPDRLLPPALLASASSTRRRSPSGGTADPAIRHPHPVGRPRRHAVGRNQQKVIVAREFSRDLALLIADQPTRGIDVGSIEFIHKQIVAKRDAGTPCCSSRPSSTRSWNSRTGSA